MATFQKRGKKWRAIVRKAGHRPLSKSFDTKGSAARWAREQERDIDSDNFTDPKVLRQITVGSLIDRFLEEFEPRRAKKGSLGILKAGLGHLHLTNLTPMDIVKHCRHRAQVDKVSPNTQSMDMGYLGEVLRTARAYWQIPYHGDPVGDARMILKKERLTGPSRARKRRPTDDELKRLKAFWQANTRQEIPISDIVDFAIASTWRMGEIARVVWADYDPDARTIIIRDRKDPRQKVGNDQVVPVFPEMQEIIERQHKTDDIIFPYKPESIGKAFIRACSQLKIIDLRFHDLRHDAISRLFEAGYQIQEVALCSGHKSWNMLARYTQLKAEDILK